MTVQKVASTSLVQMAYIPETQAGVTPSTGKGINLRLTGESMAQTVSKETSKEIESSRQTASMFVTNAEVAGGINFELSAGEYDPFIEALMMDDWSVFGTNGVLDAGSVSITAQGQITLTNAATGLEVGDYFSLSGTNISKENRGPHRVKTINGEKKVITVHGKTKQQTIADGKVHHRKISNGVTERTFSLEKRYTDIDQTFVYRGVQVDKCSWNFDMRAVITGSFDFMGMSSEVASGLQLGDKTPYTDSQTNPVIDTVLGMTDVLFNGESVKERMSAGITKLSLEYSNALSNLGAIGVLGAVDVIAGTINASGSMELYLNNAEVYNSVLNQERFRIEWTVSDRNGHGYAFILPSVELDSPEAQVGEKDNPAMINIKFNALMDPESRKTMFIQAF